MYETILIVEDHDAMRQSLRKWLEMAFPQYRVAEAKSGEEAVISAQTAPPHLVIMDLGLPGMNGIEATSAIKQAAPETRVVMLTVYEDENFRVKAAAAGAAAYVPKRRLGTELLPVLTELLNGNPGGQK
jgi:DNA-binding NarL/FixJ family response regulator